MGVKAFSPFGKKPVGQLPAEHLFDDRDRLRQRIAHKQADRSLDVEIYAKLGESHDQRLVGQCLTVDQDAVTIEDREIPFGD